jgi:hypothetical protein
LPKENKTQTQAPYSLSNQGWMLTAVFRCMKPMLFRKPKPFFPANLYCEEKKKPNAKEVCAYAVQNDDVAKLDRNEEKYAPLQLL